jgi:hypothetical protein
MKRTIFFLQPVVAKLVPVLPSGDDVSGSERFLGCDNKRKRSSLPFFVLMIQPAEEPVYTNIFGL